MPSRPQTPRTSRRKAKAAAMEAGLSRDDLKRVVLELSVQVAPNDIKDLLKRRSPILKRARANGSHLSEEQIQLALDCVGDHMKGRCPQIPLHTISLLAAGLLYLGDEIDLVPDFLTGLGDLDDAAIFAVAMSLALPGLQRYCDASGRSTLRTPRPTKTAR